MAWQCSRLIEPPFKNPPFANQSAQIATLRRFTIHLQIVYPFLSDSSARSCTACAYRELTHVARSHNLDAIQGLPRDFSRGIVRDSGLSRGPAQNAKSRSRTNASRANIQNPVPAQAFPAIHVETPHSADRRTRNPEVCQARLPAQKGRSIRGSAKLPVQSILSDHKQ